MTIIDIHGMKVDVSEYYLKAIQETMDLIDERIGQLLQIPSTESPVRIEELISLKGKLAELEKKNERV